MLTDEQKEQLAAYGTNRDHRSKNSKVRRLLSALAIELKDLPHDLQLRIDFVINDNRDGYDYNWLGMTDYWRNFLI